MKKVLVLEDESSIRSFIVINLRRAGYDVIEAESGEEALERLKENPNTKVALLDIMLPGIDGFEVCRRIRATNTKIGIIMLTARSQEMDKVTGLMTGADDYVTKPFSPAELTARVDALFRRAGGEEIPQTVSKISSRLRALPWFSINILMMAYSTWVSLIRWPFFSRVRFRVFSRKGSCRISPVWGVSSPPARRNSASTRAVSSAGEKGLVT